MTAKFTSIEAYRDGLTAEQLPVVDKLRQLASASADGVTEHIKWNAPSFGIDGDDRITLGMSPKGHARAVLHRGVKPAPAPDFSFDDPAGAIQWQARDRGVMNFTSLADLLEREGAVADTFARWMEATR